MVLFLVKEEQGLIDCHKQITFRSLKNYSPEGYEEAPRKLSFPNYELFDDIDKAYENVVQKVMAVIDNLAPSKNKRIKGTSQDWFDAEIMGRINEREKLSKNSNNLACMSIKITKRMQGMRYKNQSVQRKSLL